MRNGCAAIGPASKAGSGAQATRRIGLGAIKFRAKHRRSSRVGRVTMRKLLVLGAFLLAAGCTKGPEAHQDWAQFRDSAIDGWFQVDPSFAVYEGKHQFDGRLPDWSAQGLKTRATFLHNVIDRAGAFKDLGADDKFERDYLVQAAKGQLF